MQPFAFCTFFSAKPVSGKCVMPGEHGNAELVNKYGFALPDNPFNTVKLDKQELGTLAKQRLGSKAYKKRRKFLDDHRSADLG